ncbi:hypothetical protein GLOTRDRAFT_141032 [Gloeophyllum trabeum ATCC 11539]|uniref:Aminoglycoside phosphotransferase domain-containing protein n=1 Tax=Gloeophyllum trabeum (strain ATCC 11539 / FP-39264 / Madison 617) TaxID=670483 RepID=S7PUU1_GLOTA|nr:uncharacterized protein GLOTRDRAFT_141032 [Gloeophyllum trabeum ATCC 11539]EPQ51183.1 hypothetical protein GLOTRDRAFT_141032 [Gloeophyllum trabeum ATCC 11539]
MLRLVYFRSRAAGYDPCRRLSILSRASSTSSEYEHFYRYTSGRWIHNEEAQLAARYTRFNVDALKSIAVSAGHADSVTRIVKLAEGAYNKVFLLTLDNSREIIARIKTPHAGPAHLVTASEVATMDFVRSHLGVPVPAVLSWSSHSEQTPVKAEYIIMEKAPGIEVSTVWDKLSRRQQRELVINWLEIEKRLMAPISGGYGSLYYRADVEPSQYLSLYPNDEYQSDFVVGPSVERHFWSDERSSMDVDRGPWEDPLSYVLAVANCERRWIEKHAVPAQESGLFDMPVHLRQPRAHLSLLDRYFAVAPYLVPQDPSLLRPLLWHNDARFANVFVSEDVLARGEVQITSVIDWQHTALLPLYLQAYVPKMFRYHGTTVLPAGDQLLSLPENLNTLDEEDQATVKADVYRGNLHKLYEIYCARINPEYHKALTLATRELIHYPVKFSAKVWSSTFMLLREFLMRITAHWDAIAPGASVPCPISFTEEERQAHLEEREDWQRAQDGKDGLDRILGVDADGWVTEEGYEEAVRRNWELQEGYVRMGAEDPERVLRNWPYRPR